MFSWITIVDGLWEVAIAGVFDFWKLGWGAVSQMLVLATVRASFECQAGGF